MYFDRRSSPNIKDEADAVVSWLQTEVIDQIDSNVFGKY